MIIGYTSIVFDLFHIGHLNLLINAKRLCNRLVTYKNKKAKPTQYGMEKFQMWEQLKFDVKFEYNDWFYTERWKKFNQHFYKVSVKIIYFPSTWDFAHIPQRHTNETETHLIITQPISLFS